jgi:hypothetical protein
VKNHVLTRVMATVIGVALSFGTAHAQQVCNPANVPLRLVMALIKMKHQQFTVERRTCVAFLMC